MLIESEIELLRANQRFLVRELQGRGINVAIFDLANEVLEAQFGNRKEFFLDLDSSLMPYASGMIANSKSLTRKILTKANISVPIGISLGVQDVAAALAFAKDFSYPLVAKPSVGSQGKSVVMDIESDDDLLHALSLIEQAEGNIEILIEEQFKASEFRVFYTREGDYAALLRDPAYVIGDGHRNIEQLAADESKRRLNPRVCCLGEIVVDAEARRFLRRRGKELHYVPEIGEKVYLRNSSNVSLGGVPQDVTSSVHSSVLRICQRAIEAIPGLPYAGIDFMCQDISAMQTASSYRILEINPLPGIGIHMAPGIGEPVNVAAMIVDMVFPETKAKHTMLAVNS